MNAALLVTMLCAGSPAGAAPAGAQTQRNATLELSPAGLPAEPAAESSTLPSEAAAASAAVWPAVWSAAGVAAGPWLLWGLVALLRRRVRRRVGLGAVTVRWADEEIEQLRGEVAKQKSARREAADNASRKRRELDRELAAVRLELAEARRVALPPGKLALANRDLEDENALLRDDMETQMRSHKERAERWRQRGAAMADRIDQLEQQLAAAALTEADKQKESQP